MAIVESLEMRKRLCCGSMERESNNNNILRGRLQLLEVRFMRVLYSIL